MTEHVDQDTDEAKTSSTMSDPLPEEAVESIVAWLRVIAVPMRIRIMEILNVGGASVQGLAAQLGTSHQNASWHLGVLHQAGIVRRRRVERRTHYELVDWSGFWMVKQAGLSAVAHAEEA